MRSGVLDEGERWKDAVDTHVVHCGSHQKELIKEAKRGV